LDFSVDILPKIETAFDLVSNRELIFKPFWIPNFFMQMQMLN